MYVFCYHISGEIKLCVLTFSTISTDREAHLFCVWTSIKDEYSLHWRYTAPYAEFGARSNNNIRFSFDAVFAMKHIRFPSSIFWTATRSPLGANVHNCRSDCAV